MGESTIVKTLLGLPVFQSEWVLYLLLGLSVLSIGVIIERVIFYRRHKVDADALRHDLIKALEAGDFAAAADVLKKHDALETNSVLAGLQAYQRGPDSVEDLVSGALGREKARYEKRLGLLATLASNAPYIGLFGTVLGIIRSFKDLSVNMSEASSSVMSGISEALLATAIGLLVAIPAVMTFNFFTNRIEEFVVDMNDVGSELISFVLREGRDSTMTDGKKR